MVVTKSTGYSVEQLERLYSVLSQCIYKYRREYDKTQLLEVSDGENSVSAFKLSDQFQSRKYIQLKLITKYP